MPCIAKPFLIKTKSINRALCFLVILSSILSAATSAAAVNQKENIDKFIQDWEEEYGKSYYWKVENATAANTADEDQSRLGKRLPPPEDYHSQAALRDKVKNFLSVYGSYPSDLDSIWPAFQSWLKVEGYPLPLYSINDQQ